jgi:hypothetical protein
MISAVREAAQEHLKRHAAPAQRAKRATHSARAGGSRRARARHASVPNAAWPGGVRAKAARQETLAATPSEPRARRGEAALAALRRRGRAYAGTRNARRQPCARSRGRAVVYGSAGLAPAGDTLGSRHGSAFFRPLLLRSGLRSSRSLPIGCVPVRRLGNFMSNRAIWNVRLRHVWLATPLKGKRLKRRQRLRIGLEDALARKGKNAAAEPSTPETNG